MTTPCSHGYFDDPSPPHRADFADPGSDPVCREHKRHREDSLASSMPTHRYVFCGGRMVCVLPHACGEGE